ncbi:MFS transporter [Actinocrispum sp. NPDC049592]|uniref:MFS transporter n=1 Tax=Actinocrispum sp. NPDC049592 TaxID=3154835 RepID=UPI00342892F7
MIVLDATVMTIALPKIQADLGFSAAGLSWVQNAYLLTVGGLLLLGGRAGDILGRRRVYVTGVLVFAMASLAGGFAGSAGWLLAARAIQGVGGALAAPGAMALIATTFPAGPRRNRAIGMFSLVSGSGSAIGMILGGLVMSAASWRWALFINVPVGVAIALLAPVVITETVRVPGRFDLAGAVTSTLGSASLVYGFISAATDGWSAAATLVAFAAGVGLLAAFISIESRAAQPIMPLRLFASRTRLAAYSAMLLLPAAMFGAFFFLTQFLQRQLAFSPLGAGLALVPLPAAMIVVVRLMPRLVPLLGRARLVMCGITLIIVADLWLTALTPSTGYFTGLLGPTLVLGVGVGFSFVPLNLTILNDIPPEDAGAASGATQTLQQTGGAIGLAVLVTAAADFTTPFIVSTAFAGAALLAIVLFPRRT